MDLQQMRRVIMAQDQMITELSNALVKNLPATKSDVEAAFKTMNDVIREARQEDCELSMQGMTPEYRVRDALGIEHPKAPVDQYALVAQNDVLSAQRIADILKLYFAPTSEFNDNGGTTPLPGTRWLKELPQVSVDAIVDGIPTSEEPALVVSVDRHGTQHMLLLCYHQGIHRVTMAITSVYYNRVMDAEDLREFGGVHTRIHAGDTYRHRDYAVLSATDFEKALCRAMVDHGYSLHKPLPVYEEDAVLTYLDQHPDASTEGVFMLPDGTRYNMGLDLEAYQHYRRLEIWVTRHRPKSKEKPSVVDDAPAETIMTHKDDPSPSPRFRWQWQEAPRYRQHTLMKHIMLSVGEELPDED